MSASIFTKIATFLFLFATLCSCQKNAVEDITFAKSYTGVDEDLWMYFENFEKEAAKRGVFINLIEEGITGSVEKIHATGMVGICNHKVDHPNHVIIDIDFWNKASSINKELIVFHELGHCFLKRGHDDSKSSNGTCQSIMRSGKGGCLDFYNKSNREKYLDELYELAE